MHLLSSFIIDLNLGKLSYRPSVHARSCYQVGCVTTQGGPKLKIMPVEFGGIEYFRARCKDLEIGMKKLAGCKPSV